MKLILTFIILVFSLEIKAQSDSAWIQFVYPNNEQSVINNLNNIQFINLVCKDSNAENCFFFLRIDEYKNGKLVDFDKKADSCKVEKILFLNSKDSIWEYLSFCDRYKFDIKDSIFKIIIAGKLIKNKFKLIENYPEISSEVELDGNKKAILKEINCMDEGKKKIALNKFQPVLAYSSPFKAENENAESYCMLGTEEVSQWYQKFKVKHYYIINLEIKKMKEH